jgi:tripeptide aminopeptidase
MSGRLLDDLLELASVPAPTFAEEPRLAWLERRLADQPGRRERDAAGNLVWSFGEGPPRLLLLAHVDTVFQEGIPLEFERRGGRVTGPGIGDNAAAVVAVVHAVSALLERQPVAPGAVAFTVGEEGLGDLRGAHEACERLRPGSALAVEGHGLEHVLVDAVGSVRLRVRIIGPGGHSWYDRGTSSAIHALLAVGSELAELGRPDRPVNVGLVSGGQSINSIAAEAELVVELRALEEEPLERFEAYVRGLAVASPLSLTVELVGRRPAGRLDRADPLLATVRRVRKSLDLPDRLEAGSTDANAALVRGIPALTLGVSRGGCMHTRAEWLDADSLDLGLQQLEEVLAVLLKPA